ncbi:hypothetical protein DNU06_15910 [Putridiphycobacter roseus]|uniref:DUF4476 domain-containing protein n=1 Tax=Putridiphycobacter roseus TaxID=2219161 RepID=A0A2W1N9D2_9FLAO|nr:DUF4476 domain-containing protein [Putridiphycobacter roseus]PZE15865.1 hypothetical protein DNU06_15910 [Putridiphycobacter roseus]
MKKLFYTLIAASTLSACSLLDSAIIIDKPNLPTVNICDNVATDADVTNMVSKIKAKSFKEERMARAKLVTKDYCFVSNQVVNIMDAFSFENAKLEIAKDLYDQTTDKNNYDVVVDALVHKADRDELNKFILQ